MLTMDFLREVTGLPGLTGNEGTVAEYIAQAFKPYCDEVHITPVNSVIAHKKGPGPKVMLCAHLDEIGLMVTKIEDDGCLRLDSVGGVDSRILPGMRVRVYGKETLFGVIGAKAPHLLTEKERSENYAREDLYVDLGLPADKVRALVHTGDSVSLEYRFTELMNGRIAVKTCDDRACVAILLRAAELLQNMKHEADVYFVATCQEEIGSYGAQTAGFEVDPAFGVALDVCHAQTPGAPKEHTHALTSLCASEGPYINPFLRKKLDEIAKENGCELQSAIVPSYTSTDADELGVTRAGVPVVLLELPLKYMHTTVETFDSRVLREGGRLLAHYVAAIDGTWEDELWN